jgi:hypothetical protein
LFHFFTWAIESVFTQTNIKWKITKVEYKLEEKETVNISSDKSENGGNGDSVHVNTVSENLIRKESKNNFNYFYKKKSPFSFY